MASLLHFPSPSPKNPARVIKAKVSLVAYLRLWSTYVPFAIKLQKTKVNSDSNTCNKHPPSLLLTMKKLLEEQPEPNPGTSLFSFNVNCLLDFWTDKFGVVMVFKGGKKKNWVNCYHLYLIQFFSIWLVKYLLFFSPLSPSFGNPRCWNSFQPKSRAVKQLGHRMRCRVRR